MRLGEIIFRRFCRSPDGADYFAARMHYSLDNALDILLKAFSDGFTRDIVGKDVIDFGCGAGWQVVAMAARGARQSVGIDINRRGLEMGKRLAVRFHVAHKTQFRPTVENRDEGQFDIVVSQNSFEHFSDPRGALQTMKSLLKPTGKIYITFSPPWFAPYGSHTQFFTKLPYVNLFFSERTVMRVRSLYRNDGARKYTEAEGGLNKMTVGKFERLVSDNDLKVIRSNYIATKHLQFLTSLPGLRELFTNRVSCVLRPQQVFPPTSSESGNNGQRTP